MNNALHSLNFPAANGLAFASQNELELEGITKFRFALLFRNFYSQVLGTGISAHGFNPKQFIYGQLR